MMMIIMIIKIEVEIEKMLGMNTTLPVIMTPWPGKKEWKSISVDPWTHIKTSSSKVCHGGFYPFHQVKYTTLL